MSLVEAAISTFVLAVMLVGALQLVGAVHRTRVTVSDRARAASLANDLMTEILDQEFEDPDDTDPNTIAREAGESPLLRRDWDDIDDYHGWVGAPPRSADGDVLPGWSAWTRSVSVEWIRPEDPSIVVPPDGRAKRITVTVQRPPDLVVSLVAVRSSAWPSRKSLEPVRVLLVIEDPDKASGDDRLLFDRLAGWGFEVESIDDDAGSAEFADAFDRNDAVLVATSARRTNLLGKIRPATIGVVNEMWDMREELGFEDDDKDKDIGRVRIQDPTHYITSVFETQFVYLFDKPTRRVMYMDGKVSPDLHELADAPHNDAKDTYGPSLGTLEPGDRAWDLTPVAGKRVSLPWSVPSYKTSTLSEDAWIILKRSVEWAAGREAR
ncbi:MAG: hypothetical protein ACF8QF_11740 [Phycisphaerales bacterium]